MYVLISEILLYSFYSDDVRDLTFTVIIDMRKSTWTTVKPILKVMQENFATQVHTAYIIKPDNFWQKQRTSMGSQKYKFDVSTVTAVIWDVRNIAFRINICSGSEGLQNMKYTFL